MMEDKFEIVTETGEVIASNMRMEVAIILIKAYFDEYYRETKLALTIRKMLM